MRRSDMHDRIRAIHHRGEDVRASDMSNLLGGLANVLATSVACAQLPRNATVMRPPPATVLMV
jgi:hypothetical protein